MWHRRTARPSSKEGKTQRTCERARELWFIVLLVICLQDDSESCETEPKRVRLTDEVAKTAAQPSGDGEDGLEPESGGAVDSRTGGPENDGSSSKSGGETGRELKELERDRDCEDVREKIRRKFLVDMPEDFYQFWEFCKSINPSQPQCKLMCQRVS